LKPFEGIWLVCQEKDPKFPAKVINKSQKISLVIVGDRRAWRSWSGCDARHILSRGNEFLCCLPSTQSSHNRLEHFNCGNPWTICFCCRVWRPPNLKWPYRQCQR
jgi:hypothetical protein